MVSLAVAEELGGAEALGGEELGIGGESGGGFEYSGGGLDGARYEPYEYYNFNGGNALVGLERYGLPKRFSSEYRGVGLPEHPDPKIGNTNASSSAFKEDEKPKGFNWQAFYNASFVVNTAGGILKGITDTIASTYNNYRKDKQLNINSRENLKDRYRAGIVFQGQESRDQLVRSNQMPAYYSTSNIKSLLRRGIMPFGWNSEMAIEQGFGQEVFAQEQKAVTTRNSEEFLQREKDKRKFNRTLGELKNLRNRFKTRKILEYYNQN